MARKLSQLPPEAWTARDKVPPEGFERWQIDRKFEVINSVYGRNFGRLHSPLAAAVQAVRQTGEVALLDVGCGTGRTLWEFAEAVRKATGCAPESIRGVGLSLHDYSGQSCSPAARVAFAEGQLGYVKGRAERLSNYKLGTFDVVLSHEALIYSKRPDMWANELRRALGHTGVAFFNAAVGPDGGAPDSIGSQFDNWHGHGYDIMGLRAFHLAATNLPPSSSYYIRMEAIGSPEAG
jgi:ubiquinone/menaquinone biosynthesis C-methylase UbiE